jgi:hypothetical protein
MKKLFRYAVVITLVLAALLAIDEIADQKMYMPSRLANYGLPPEAIHWSQAERCREINKKLGTDPSKC